MVYFLNFLTFCLLFYCGNSIRTRTIALPSAGIHGSFFRKTIKRDKKRRKLAYSPTKFITDQYNSISPRQIDEISMPPDRSLHLIECRNEDDCKGKHGMDKCCAFGCCSKNEYAAQSCFFNFNCPRSRMNNSRAFCCSNGCCTHAQYSSGSCAEDTDCPGNNTEYSVLHTKCCASGCCTPYVHSSPRLCRTHDDCPGRYGQRDEEFCCGGRCCCEFDEHLRYCLNHEDCSVSTNERCCDGVCCHKESIARLAVIITCGIIAFLVIMFCSCQLCLMERNNKTREDIRVENEQEMKFMLDGNRAHLLES